MPPGGKGLLPPGGKGLLPPGGKGPIAAGRERAIAAGRERVKDFPYKPSKLKLAPRFWSIGPPLNKFGSEHKNSN